jgi:translation elongation factor EF-1alpha
LLLDALEAPERLVEKPLRLSISNAFKGTMGGTFISGKIDSGVIQIGDQVLLMPLNQLVNIKSKFIH